MTYVSLVAPVIHNMMMWCLIANSSCTFRTKSSGSYELLRSESKLSSCVWNKIWSKLHCGLQSCIALSCSSQLLLQETHQFKQKERSDRAVFMWCVMIKGIKCFSDSLQWCELASYREIINQRLFNHCGKRCGGKCSHGNTYKMKVSRYMQKRYHCSEQHYSIISRSGSGLATFSPCGVFGHRWAICLHCGGLLLGLCANSLPRRWRFWSHICV